MEELAERHPDLRDAYLAKKAYLLAQAGALDDKEKVIASLDDLELTFDQVEEQLKKVEAGKLN